MAEGSRASPESRQLRVARSEGRHVSQGGLRASGPIASELHADASQERLESGSAGLLVGVPLASRGRERPRSTLLGLLAATDAAASLGLDQAAPGSLLEARVEVVGEPLESLEDLLKADLGLAVATCAKQLLALREDPADLDSLLVDSPVNAVLEGLGHARDLALAVAEDELGPELGLEDPPVVGVGSVGLAEAAARLAILEARVVGLAGREVVPRQGRALLVAQRELGRELPQPRVLGRRIGVGSGRRGGCGEGLCWGPGGRLGGAARAARQSEGQEQARGAEREVRRERHGNSSLVTAQA
jgi:hypothetical protein